MLKFQSIRILLAALFFTSTLFSQDTLLERARQAFELAQQREGELKAKPATERTPGEYQRVINLYRRVFLITPHTGFADNALLNMALLYEESGDTKGAIRTLEYLLREYPRTPFRDTAEQDLARLSGTTEQAAAEKKAAMVDNIRYWEAISSVRVVVDMSGEATFKQGEARNPDRVFLDISPSRLNSQLIGKQFPVKMGLLEQVRVGQYDAGTVRVVLDVQRIGRVTVFALRDPFRLIMDVHGGEPAASAPSPTPPPAAPETRTVEPEAKVGTPAKPTNRGGHSLIRSLGLKISRVVIDAGHGGPDTGSIGPSGFSEKELVLDVAKRLKDLIETQLGAEVVMTRNDDTFVSLEARTAIANQEAADLFLSIHANSSRARSARGVETYFLNFTTSREALEIAARENASSERSIHELQDLIKKIAFREKLDESREFASYMQRALAARKGSGKNRGVKRAPFLVLVGANMPSVLTEVCFISNPQDERTVKSPATRQRIAESLFAGVKSYSESLSGFKTVKVQE